MKAVSAMSGRLADRFLLLILIAFTVNTQAEDQTTGKCYPGSAGGAGGDCYVISTTPCDQNLQHDWKFISDAEIPANDISAGMSLRNVAPSITVTITNHPTIQTVIEGSPSAPSIPTATLQHRQRLQMKTSCNLETDTLQRDYKLVTDTGTYSTNWRVVNGADGWPSNFDTTKNMEAYGTLTDNVGSIEATLATVTVKVFAIQFNIDYQQHPNGEVCQSVPIDETDFVIITLPSGTPSVFATTSTVGSNSAILLHFQDGSLLPQGRYNVCQSI